jgi:hypothetical protein
MPDGKPAMVPCVNLLPDMQCAIFNHPERPKVCAGFKPEPEMCGSSPDEAARNFKWLLGME